MEQRIEVEEVTVRGERLQLLHREIPVDQLDLDPDNPRIRYRLGLEPGKTPEQELLSWPGVSKLRKDIEKTGGLRERIIVQPNGSGKYRVIEGNCRTACYRSLHTQHEDDVRWMSVPARIVPERADSRALAILLMDFHVVGKIAWKAHEKAAQVHKMNFELGMPMDDIALYMRSSKTTVQRLLDAYKLMSNVFLKMDGGKYASQGDGVWSFFEELYKRRELKDWRDSGEEFTTNFCRWVGDGRLQKGEQVRNLGEVLKHPEARKKFEDGDTGTALKEAMEVVRSVDPSIDSDFFKLLGKVRNALTSAAQVKEIIRIRKDQAARKQVLETYSALIEFMKLAEVDPTEDGRGQNLG